MPGIAAAGPAAEGMAYGALNIGLYLHIPFCASRCAYCDFCSTADRRDLMPRYQAALLGQIASAERAPADSVYFGGGTPSYYGAERLCELLRALRERFDLTDDCEITTEANPDSVTAEGLRLLRSEGFDRLSFGAQSADAALLKRIRRRHSWEQVGEAFAAARAAGFENLSLDLIYGLPGQTEALWEQTLSEAMKLEPEHISCYGLTIEEGTPLWAERFSPELPDDDAQADMYLNAVRILAERGFAQYEISNFARPGRESRHNLKYWTQQEFLGFGASAASFRHGRRFTCLRDVEGWMSAAETGKNPYCEDRVSDNAEQASEYVMLGLRTARGISPAEYEARYGLSFAPAEAVLARYEPAGLTARTERGWRLTPKGFLLSNAILSEMPD